MLPDIFLKKETIPTEAGADKNHDLQSGIQIPGLQQGIQEKVCTPQFTRQELVQIEEIFKWLKLKL
jgi:hypothetical protein